MEGSFFSKLYSYRERPNKDSKENFLIEIFCYCLQSDANLFSDFLRLLEIKKDNSYTVQTQKIYELGRPDLEINLFNSSTCIFIECKIEHHERQNQLSDYAKILQQKPVKNKHLLYLTKFYDYKELSNREVFYHHLKWKDIHALIDVNRNQATTIELKKYLEENNMAESSNFNYQDLAALSNISTTIRKMDEVLDGIKPIFEKAIGGLSKESARSTRLKDSWYVSFHDVVKNKQLAFSVNLGFFWWDEDIFLAVRLYLPKRENRPDVLKYKETITTHLKKWEIEEWDDSFNFWHYESVANFVISGEEQIPSMIEFLKTGIEDISNLKQKDRKLFESK